MVRRRKTRVEARGGGVRLRVEGGWERKKEGEQSCLNGRIWRSWRTERGGGCNVKVCSVTRVRGGGDVATHYIFYYDSCAACVDIGTSAFITRPHTCFKSYIVYFNMPRVRSADPAAQNENTRPCVKMTIATISPSINFFHLLYLLLV